MKDFFIVSHKYVTNNMSITAELPNKCLHLNDAIKKLILRLKPVVNDVYYIATDNNTKLVVPDTDSVSGDTYIFDSGKGSVNDNKLNLDIDT